MGAGPVRSAHPTNRDEPCRGRDRMHFCSTARASAHRSMKDPSAEGLAAEADGGGRWGPPSRH